MSSSKPISVIFDTENTLKILTGCMSYLFLNFRVQNLWVSFNYTWHKAWKNLSFSNQRPHFPRGDHWAYFNQTWLNRSLGKRIFFSICRTKPVSIRKSIATCWKYFEGIKKFLQNHFIDFFTTHGKNLLWVIGIQFIFIFLLMKNHSFLKKEINFFSLSAPTYWYDLTWNILRWAMWSMGLLFIVNWMIWSICLSFFFPSRNISQHRIIITKLYKEFH